MRQQITALPTEIATVSVVRDQVHVELAGQLFVRHGQSRACGMAATVREAVTLLTSADLERFLLDSGFQRSVQ